MQATASGGGVYARQVRLGVKYDGIAERIGAALNLVPVPIGLSMFGMPIARSLQVAQRTGVLGLLAESPASAPEVAIETRAARAGDGAAAGCADCVGRGVAAGRRALLRSTRAPPSGCGRIPRHYVGDFLADTSHYWEWWAGLEDLVRDGRSIELHATRSRRSLLAVVHHRPVPARPALERRRREGGRAALWCRVVARRRGRAR